MLLKRKGRLTRRAMLASRIWVNPAVTIKALDSGRVMMVYEKSGGRVVRWLRGFFAISTTVEVLLDEIGTKVVSRIDGTCGVADLIAFVVEDLKLNRKEAEVALLKYMDMLARRNLIGFEPVVQETGRR
jgi:hypothetical protein